ncbi:MAG: polysaccharide deacetylase family protein [Patescibacteria group bacterium]|nr:polysaccharide deacetylase family protein [Patescibacteria group bacterium]
MRNRLESLGRTMLIAATLAPAPVFVSDISESDGKTPQPVPIILPYAGLMSYEKYQLVKTEKESTQNNLPSIFSSGDKKRPLVAITIDDAGNSTNVKMALDIAKEKQVHLTFFPVGSVISSQKDLWKKAVEDGHEIGNHTFNHKQLPALSENEIKRQINLSQEALDKALGFSYPMHLLRPPGGGGGYRGGDPRLLKIAGGLGYSLVMWSVDPLYAVVVKPKNDREKLKKQNPDAVVEEKPVTSADFYQHVVSATGNGSIILLHFNRNDIGALGQIIDTLRERGLELTTVSGLFSGS